MARQENPAEGWERYVQDQQEDADSRCPHCNERYDPESKGDEPRYCSECGLMEDDLD